MAENVRIDIHCNDGGLTEEELAVLHLKNRMRRLAYITVIVLVLTAVVFAFALTIMNVTTPKFRIKSVEVDHFTLGNDKLAMKLDVEVAVKNSNFGHFKYGESEIEFEYRGNEAGEALIGKERARARSTKTMSVSTKVKIDSDEKVQRDVKLGFLTLTAEAEMNGKVHLMKVIRVQKTAVMNCTVVLDLAKKVARDLNCK